MSTFAGTFCAELSPVARAMAERHQPIIINRDWNSNRNSFVFMPDTLFGAVKT
jgi:hypothetical protein